MTNVGHVVRQLSLGFLVGLRGRLAVRAGIAVLTHRDRLLRLVLLIVRGHRLVLQLLLVLLVLIIKERWVVLLVVHVGLRWLVFLVDFHLLHLLRQLSLLFVLDCLFLHGDVGATEFLEHVLVVKDRVSKLITERITFQEL